MRVAITAWGDTISPVFDSAQMLLIAEINNSRIISRHYEKFHPEAVSRLAENLGLMNIEILICGAISDVFSNIIENTGIKLIPFIRGNVDQVLNSFTKEIQIDSIFLMPGCGRKKHHKNRNRNVCANQQEEVKIMPRRDGTGPEGKGAGSGQGRGGCKAGNSGRGSGRGRGRSNRRVDNKKQGRQRKNP